MRLGSLIRLRFRSLFSRKRVEQELDEELRYHLEREIDARVLAGIMPEDARYAALQSIRDVEQRKEECRDMRRMNVIDNLARDFRYTVRRFRKNPVFACTAIFVLALGISATVAIFGFVEAALIKPLPYREQSRLVAVFESSPGAPRSWLSYLDFVDWKKLNRVFSSIDAYALNGSFTMSSVTGAEQVPGTRVSAGFFQTLGVQPVLGRDFRAGEDAAGAPRTVIISYSAWHKRFGGKRDVLGRSLTLNGNTATVIGVLPRDFQFAPYGGAEFWATLRASDSCEQHRGCHNLITIARLRDGVSMETASADMRSVAQQLRRQYPDTNRDFGGANLVPLRDFIIGDVRPILLVLLSGAILLLLMAGVNVTTLLLSRSDKRQREIAVRGALGASSSRLFHQFATEGFVLAAIGGAVGLVFSEWGIRLLTGLVPAEKMESMPYLRGLGLNGPTVALACGISLVAGVMFSIVPIARTSLSEMIESLKEGARGSAGTTWRRFGSGLVVIEVALAMVLMVSAGLLGQSLYQLLHLDLGFKPDHLAYFQTSWAPGRYETDEQTVVVERRMVDRISTLPDVVSVSTSTAPPIDSAWGTASFHIVGQPNHKENNEVINRQVSADYFRTLQARLWEGRYFKEDENASKPPVVIINRTLANKYFRSEDPIGKQIYYDWEPQSAMQVVGVVDDIKEGPLEDPNWAALYVPNDQRPVGWPAILVRTSQPPESLFPRIAAAIHSVDPFITVSGEETMTERINQSPSAYLHRSAAWLVGIFAGAALLLGVVGFYGVVAYSVGQRTREIGVRMALGAERNAVYRLVLGEAGRLTAVGIVIGIAGSLGAAILLRTLLFGVQPWDAPTLVGVAVLLGISSILASYIPARRAASVNPVEALRVE
ncbi:MAG TPA: ABC transporter permease [Bryobacteraceae bacterium]|nr:ABC transporter permease [Bryobacteraceae bacterium]